MDALFVILLIVGIVCALRHPAFWIAVAAILATKLLGLDEKDTPMVFLVGGLIIGVVLVISVWDKTKRAFAEGKGEDKPKA